MDFLDKLKYKEEIGLLLKQGINLPNDVIPPIRLDAYRWVFDYPHPNNHKPAYVTNPERIIQNKDKEKLTTSGYALSCFQNEDIAESKFNTISISFPNFWKTVGNSIFYGILDNNDGVVTSINNNGHFDLYEFSECKLDEKFILRKKLK